MARPKRSKKASLAVGSERPPAKVRRIVAVTGPSSFLGKNLVAQLTGDRAIDRVVTIDLKPHEGAVHKRMRHYEVDLTQPSAEARLAEIFAAERVTTLVHLAFHASPPHATAYAHELEAIGTMHAFLAARHARVRKIVLRSLTWLYGAHPTSPNYLGEHQPLRARKDEPFFADKVEAEAELARMVERDPSLVGTVLRLAPVVGPTVESFLTKYLSRRMVPTMMGFDPLVQLVHEADAIAALKLAVDRDVPGTFNVCGDGVLPLSAVVRLAGRTALPVPYPVAESLVAVAWLAQLSPVPPTFLPYLRFVCVADGARAKDVMGFRPAFTTREALMDFVNAQQRRETNLLETS